MEKLKIFGNKILGFAKANWQTGLGLASFVYVILEAIFGFIGQKLACVGIDPNISYAILTPLYGFIVNGLAKQGFEKPSKFNERKAIEKVEKDEQKVILDAKKEKSKLEKEALALNKALEKENAKIAKEAELKAKAEQEKLAKAEHEAKVKAYLEQLQKEKEAKDVEAKIEIVSEPIVEVKAETTQPTIL